MNNPPVTSPPDNADCSRSGQLAGVGLSAPALSYSHLEARVAYVSKKVDRLQAAQDAKRTHKGQVRLVDARHALLAAENELARACNE